MSEKSTKITLLISRKMSKKYSSKFHEFMKKISQKSVKITPTRKMYKKSVKITPLISQNNILKNHQNYNFNFT